MRFTIGPRRQGLLRAIPDGPPPGERLSGHTDRSGTTMHGWPAVLFGVPFAAAGVIITVLGALGRLNSPGTPSPWVPISCGWIFAAAGLWLMAHGVKGVARKSRAARQRAANPREPWAWDHAWNPMGSEDDSERRIRRELAAGIGMVVFLVPFNAASFVFGGPPIPFIAFTALADLLIISLLGHVGYMLAQRRKYGVSMLRFRRFPFAPGRELEVMLPRVGPLEALASLEATLRCVQERYEVRRTGSRRSSSVVSYAVWSETRASEQGDGRRSTERELRWRFVVPPDAPGTSLAERPPRYWELEVRAEVPGIDYLGVFLVPVYEDGREQRVRLAG